MEYTDYVIGRGDGVGKAGDGLLGNVRDDSAYERRSDLEQEDIEMIWLEVVYSFSINAINQSINLIMRLFHRPSYSKANQLNKFN